VYGEPRQHRGMEPIEMNWTDDRIDALSDRVDTGFEQVDKRFEQVDKQFERIDLDIRALRSDMNARFESMESRFDRRFEILGDRLAAMQRMLLQVTGGMLATLVAALFALIATQL
jgi:CII-binding regulator of phage lambda lysogenization HflD